MTLDEKILKYQNAFNKLEEEQNTINLKHRHELFIFRDKKSKIYSEIELDLDDKKLTQIIQMHHKIISMCNLRNLLEPFPKIVNQIDRELIKMENNMIQRYESLRPWKSETPPN